MIRHISLENWKAFENLELDLPEGTSFIVARNGLGKTSLLQALHFALFGDRRLLSSRSTVERAVRGGADSSARVKINVDLGSDEWVIERFVPGGLITRQELPAPTVWMNGNPLSERAWTDALVQTAGVGMTELRLLASIGEGGTLAVQDPKSTDSYNLVHHLSDVMGVSRLRTASEVLRKTAREAFTQANNERLTLRDRPERSAVGERERLLAERDLLAGRITELQEQLEHVRSRQKVRSDWAMWRDRDRAARKSAVAAATKISTAVAEHREVLGELDKRRFEVDLAPDSSALVLIEQAATMQRQARSLLDGLRAQRDAHLRATGSMDARLTSIDAALELLSRAEAICPTCRQPLSDESAERARAEHLREREAARVASALARADTARVDVAMADIAEAINFPALRAVPPPDEPMPEGSPEQDEAENRELSSQIDDARGQLQLIDASLQAIEVGNQQRAADAALSRRLVSQYRRADLASLTADSFDRLADTMCRHRINPLAELLAKRWAELWPGRPSLSLNLDTGALLGTVAQTEISLSDLSGGERAVAIVLLRLLALQSASNSPVLLMDEPLEHLDPRNRRLLANLLVAATRSAHAPPRQILVTTYEESVTRRLGQPIAGEGSNVVYVAAQSADLV